MNQVASDHSLNDVREGLARLVDLILPGTDVLPSGRSVGAHSELLDRALEADPARLPHMLEIGARLINTDTISIELLESWETEAVDSVVFVLTASYYMSRAVHRALRYAPMERHPVADATPDQLLSDELLVPVRERGEIFVVPQAQ